MNANALDARVGELWWLGVIQGVLTLLFGLAALFWPGLTLVTLVYLFSAYVLVWGIVEIVRSLMSIDRVFGSWILMLVFGVFALGVGVYLVRHPHVTFATLVLLIGFTLIVRGVFEVVAGFIENRTATAKVLNVIAGLIAVVAGIIILRQPVSGGVAFVWILGLYALLFGPLMIAMAMDARNLVTGTTARR